MSATTTPRRSGIRRSIGSAAIAAIALIGSALAPVQAAGPASRLMIVLDASGSMKEPASGGGGTRMDAAKASLTSVIDGLPADQQVGFRVFGAQISDEKDPAACTDSQLITPIQAGHADDLKNAVAATTPKGETPIGFALQEAGKDLGSDGKRSIVLVSDGESTCAPPPCDVARQMSAQGVDVTINAVGFDVQGPARDTLQCIAAAGNGEYYDVGSAADLTRTLSTLATRAERLGAGTGQPIKGTPTAAGAPAITEGRWLDELGLDPAGLTKYYTVKRTMKGSTIVVSARLRTQSEEMESSDVEIETIDGDSCPFTTDSSSTHTGQLLAGAAAAGPFTYDGSIAPEDPCAVASDLVVKVVNDYATARFARPLEITVTEVPAAENLTSLPAADASDATVGWASPPKGTTGPTVVGGTTFEDAPVLSTGTYLGEIVPGELQTFQVQADWGQTVTASADFPPPSDPALQDAISNGENPWISLDVFGPTGARATSLKVADAPGSTDLLSTVSTSRVGAQTPAIRYRNLAAENIGDLGAGTPGIYTVTVHLTPDAAGGTYTVPFVLHLGVSGEVSGQPGFAGSEEIAGGVPTDDGSTASRGGSGFAVPSLVTLGIGALGVVGLLVVVLAIVVLRTGRRRPL